MSVEIFGKLIKAVPQPLSVSDFHPEPLPQRRVDNRGPWLLAREVLRVVFLLAFVVVGLILIVGALALGAAVTWAVCFPPIPN